MAPKRVQSSVNDPIIIAIRKATSEKELKAHSLALKADLSLQTTQRLLAGSGSPTLSTLRAVCAVVGLELTAKAKR